MKCFALIRTMLFVSYFSSLFPCVLLCILILLPKKISHFWAVHSIFFTGHGRIMKIDFHRVGNERNAFFCSLSSIFCAQKSFKRLAKIPGLFWSDFDVFGFYYIRWFCPIYGGYVLTRSRVAFLVYNTKRGDEDKGNWLKESIELETNFV